jgi:hypothetical protein
MQDNQGRIELVMSSMNSEDLQLYLLNCVDKQGSIKDTADLKVDGQDLDQQAVHSALKSLEVRQV